MHQTEINLGPTEAIDIENYGFWRYADPSHRLYEKGHPLEPVLFNYYVLLDQWLGRLMEALPDSADLFILAQTWNCDRELTSNMPLSLATLDTA